MITQLFQAPNESEVGRNNISTFSCCHPLLLCTVQGVLSAPMLSLAHAHKEASPGLAPAANTIVLVRCPSHSTAKLARTCMIGRLSLAMHNHNEIRRDAEAVGRGECVATHRQQAGMGCVGAHSLPMPRMPRMGGTALAGSHRG